MIDIIKNILKQKNKIHIIMILMLSCLTNHLFDVTKHMHYLMKWKYMTNIRLAIEYANFFCVTLFHILAYALVLSIISTCIVDLLFERHIYIDEHLVAFKLFKRSLDHIQAIFEFLIIVLLLSYLLNINAVLFYWKNYSYESLTSFIPIILGIFCACILFFKLYTSYFYIYTSHEYSKDD